MRDYAYFMRAAVRAADSAPGYNNRQKTGAVIVRKNRIISVGFNSTKSHPLAKLYSKHPNAIYLHAEIHAIIKYLRVDSSISGSSIFIARRTYDSRKKPVGYGLAKPCEGCAAAIAHFNFGLVAYSVDSSPNLSYITVDIRRNRVEKHEEI